MEKYVSRHRRRPCAELTITTCETLWILQYGLKTSSTARNVADTSASSEAGPPCFKEARHKQARCNMKVRYMNI